LSGRRSTGRRGTLRAGSRPALSFNHARRSTGHMSAEEELKKALEELRKQGEEMGKKLDASIKELEKVLEQLAPKPREAERKTR